MYRSPVLLCVENLPEFPMLLKIQDLDFTGAREVAAIFFIRADLPARGRWCSQQGTTYQLAIYEQSALRA